MEFYTKNLIIALILLVSAPLSAQLKGVVNQGEFSEYAIAAPDILFEGTRENDLSRRLTKTLRRDLAFTGFFNVLNEKGYLEKPQTPVDKIDFKNWSNIAANGLIKATFKGSNPVELTLYYFDVASGKKLLQKIYKASPKTIKRGVHSFVKDLVYLLTNEKLTFFNSKIAFIEKLGGKYSLVTTDFDGTNRQKLYSSKKILLLPSWSKNGKHIYFTSYAKRSPHLYAINVKNRKLSLISDYPGLNTSATSSPNSKEIALRLSKDGNAEIYLMNLKTRKLKRLTKNMSIDTAPTFSPDGKEIAFVSNRSGNPHIYRLFVNNPSRVERLTIQGKYNQDPDYSPDGKYIAFTGRDEFYKFDIFLFDVKSRIISRVTQKQGKNENPTFSPDAKLIAFSSDRNGKNSLYLSNIKGDKQFLIYSGKGQVITPSWSPQIISTP